MKVHFYNINYDTDGESIDLPTELTLEVDDDIDVSLEGADLISDETGFCVNSFNFEIEIQ
jgi:heme/copper-type cytochrome/quinol oxidase subunit 2